MEVHMKLKIAVVQQEGNPGCLELNRANAYEAAKQALAENADIILFHEEMTLGYSPLVEELAEPVDGETTQGFIQLLQGHDSCIVYGLSERDGDKYYISAPVVTANGVIANYRKVHLWHCNPTTDLRHEPTIYTAGDRFVTFRWKGAKIGIIICYDGDFHECADVYRRAGCSVVLWMNNRPDCGNGHYVWDHALHNSMYFAVSCCCGPDEKGEHCPGGSNITGYDGKPIVEIWDKPGIIYAEIDPDEALAHRPNNHYVFNRRDDLYYNDDACI